MGKLKEAGDEYKGVRGPIYFTLFLKNKTPDFHRGIIMRI
jgi:hypothetical protein